MSNKKFHESAYSRRASEDRPTSRTHRRTSRKKRRLAKMVTFIALLTGCGIGASAIYGGSLVGRILLFSKTSPSLTSIRSGQSGVAIEARGNMQQQQNKSSSPDFANDATHTQNNKVPSLPSKEEILGQMIKDPLPSAALIHVQAQSQLPQLKNGCEVTSLSMLLSYIKHPVSKMKLAQEEPVDKTPLVMKDNHIVSWGNPNVGFVGSVSGSKKLGFGIYHGPLTKFVNEILPKRGLDLTGLPFQKIEGIVAKGTPVELWTTYTFKPTNLWTTWHTPEGPIRVTMQEHAVLLVGYNKNYVFINNPANKEAAQKLLKAPFIKAWDQLGNQAVTIAPEKFQD